MQRNHIITPSTNNVNNVEINRLISKKLLNITYRKEVSHSEI